MLPPKNWAKKGPEYVLLEFTSREGVKYKSKQRSNFVCKIRFARLRLVQDMSILLIFSLKLKLLCTFQYQDPVQKHNIIKTVLQHKKAQPKKAVFA